MTESPMYKVASSVRDAELIALRRPQIAEAAFAVFRDRGFKAATTEEIAKRLKIDKATMYGYIGCKEDLLYFVFFHLIPPLTQRLVALIPDNPDPKSRLDALIEEQIRILDEHRELVLLTYRELRHLPQPMMESVLKIIRAHQAPYEQALRDGIDAGVFRRIDPTITANALLSMLYMWATYQWLLGPSGLRAVSDTVKQIFFGGIYVPPSLQRP